MNTHYFHALGEGRDFRNWPRPVRRNKQTLRAREENDENDPHRVRSGDQRSVAITGQRH